MCLNLTTQRLLAGVSLFFIFLPNAFAASELSSSNSNPASMTVKLDAPCANATAQFEKELTHFLKKAPFMRDVRRMNNPEWNISENSQTYKTYSKKIFTSVTPTMSREFPVTFLTVKGTKSECVLKPDGTRPEGCTDNTYYQILGSEAISYRKAIETNKSGNYLKSFNINFNFSYDTPTTCRFVSVLTVVDNTYLWAKSHLIGKADPNMVESKILSRFVDWSKEMIPQLESK